MSLYLQGLRHYSALHAGLLLLPTALGALVFSPLSGRMVAARGSRPSLMTAGALLALSSVMLMFLTPTTPVVLLLVIFALFSAGFAMTSAPVISTSLSGMPPDRAGAAAAVHSTAKQVGVSLGVALCGLLAGGALRVEPTFTMSTRPLWLVTALIGVLVAALGFVSTSARVRHVAADELSSPEA
jgi:predicted MFS family arabinose efflux permease